MPWKPRHVVSASSWHSVGHYLLAGSQPYGKPLGSWSVSVLGMAEADEVRVGGIRLHDRWVNLIPNCLQETQLEKEEGKQQAWRYLITGQGSQISTCLISISPVLIRYSLESRPEYQLSPLGSWIPDIGFHGSLGPSRQGADRADVAQCELWSSSCCSGNTTTLVTIVLEQSILCFILVTTFLFLFPLSLSLFLFF